MSRTKWKFLEVCHRFSIFSSSLLEKHKTSLSELIRRDKNHPSVIMWSLANEPRTNLAAADPYFQEVVRHVKSLDTSRPVTIAIARSYYDDRAVSIPFSNLFLSLTIFLFGNRENI